MSHGWMVKSSHGGSLVEALLEHHVVAIRWDDFAANLNGLTKKKSQIGCKRLPPTITVRQLPMRQSCSLVGENFHEI
jgi:hypothetical protein